MAKIKPEHEKVIKDLLYLAVSEAIEYSIPKRIFYQWAMEVFDAFDLEFTAEANKELGIAKRKQIR